MIKGDVFWYSKKLGQTLPVMVSSNLAATASPRTLLTRKIKTPFQAGQTGSRAFFSILSTRRTLLTPPDGFEGGDGEDSTEFVPVSPLGADEAKGLRNARLREVSCGLEKEHATSLKAIISRATGTMFLNIVIVILMVKTADQRLKIEL
jgi:hypothetical protein